MVCRVSLAQVRNPAAGRDGPGAAVRHGGVSRAATGHEAGWFLQTRTRSVNGGPSARSFRVAGDRVQSCLQVKCTMSSSLTVAASDGCDLLYSAD